MVTVEEGTTVGGAGSAVAEALSEAGLSVPLMRLGLPDRFMDHGDSALLLTSAGLDAPGIQAAVRSRLDGRC
jgi:1-deoxy-D-xylulose-5-phosphate synthase